MADAAPAQNDPVQHLLHVGGGYVAASALYVVAEAGVADHLASGPKTCAELAEATNTNEDALYRIMRLLASAGVFEEAGPRSFALNTAAAFLQKSHPQSARDLVLFIADPFHHRVYADLMESLRTGRPAAEKTVGMPVFEYLAKNPEYSEVFNRAMTNFSAAIIPAALDAYDFGDIGTLVDIAGGHGEVLINILRKYPKMRGVLVDLGHVIEGARSRLASAGVADRVQTVAGDFFKAVPPGGDAYLMKHIIHDWNDEKATLILRNVRAALGDTKGRMLLLEGVVAQGSGPGFGKVLDIEMMVLPGGRERTADEFRALFAGAGFDLMSITPTKSPICVIEARPK